jgi:pyruvate formate lyase activating enzyme
LNHDLAWAKPLAVPVRRWTPEEVVTHAKDLNCDGLAWTFNEAALWLPFVIACNKLARTEGLYTVLVTNGAYGPHALAHLLPTLDVWRVDIKAWTDETYRDLLGAPIPASVARAATETAAHAGVHVEVVTCLVPGFHDQWDAVAPIANWIRDALGPSTPWHLIAFHPQGALRKLPPFARETLAAHQGAARAVGLQRVYAGGDGLDPTEAAGALHHYELRGPRGEFLRLTVDRATGAVGYIGDEALLDQVVARCQAEGLNLQVQTQSRCG